MADDKLTKRDETRVTDFSLIAEPVSLKRSAQLLGPGHEGLSKREEARLQLRQTTRRLTDRIKKMISKAGCHQDNVAFVCLFVCFIKNRLNGDMVELVGGIKRKAPLSPQTDGTLVGFYTCE